RRYRLCPLEAAGAIQTGAGRVGEHFHLGTKTSLLVSMWSHEYWEPVRTKCQTVVMAGTPPDASQVPVQAVMLP
ncbi:hypothetical protein XVE_1620, partial [Xanthomonas vesicatoria ATCC 35937]